MTLLEIMLASVLLIVGVLGFGRVLVSSMQATDTNHEVGIATEAARRMMETLQATDFPTAFALFNDFAADDPGGAGTGPGKDFAVAGLDVRAGDPDGMVGEVLFPVQPGAPGLLVESLVDPRFGTPRDLDGDGDDDGQIAAGNYGLLPVVVRLEWAGSQLEFRTLLSNYSIQ